MRPDLLALAADLAARGEAFALATVVRREAPFSGQPGDMALVTPDGTFRGWVGGSCTQPVVAAEALRALSDGAPRLIALTPDPSSDRRKGVSVFPMTCHSGGSVDVYIEPVLPAPRLVIFGLSPVARALSRLGKAMGYSIDAADPEADRAAFPEADRVGADARAPVASGGPSPAARRFAVVATMGDSDEDSVLAALALEPAYLAVVASSKRFGQMRETLSARGASPESVGLIHNPAGLDIGARTPGEIALSILAEIVQSESSRREERESAVASPPPAKEERDPVCGMTVSVATAAARTEFNGRTYYFCCQGCRDRFVVAPERYVAALPSTPPGLSR
ncbi:MAG TPA: XdhC family protein [Thermoanaerobaculia bacterium]|jgi:xanthine dehydrogenase accessory factor|nr:XdhC family protein [Thermoanaerobaculia bacterium]